MKASLGAAVMFPIEEVAVGISAPGMPAAKSAVKRVAKSDANGDAELAAKNVADDRSRHEKRQRRGGRAGTRDQRGSYARRLMANLRRSECSLEALAAYGLEQSAIIALGLGIKEPYLRADGATVSGVLVYPVAAVDGRNRYGCINLPGTTENPEHVVGWSPGPADAVIYGSGDIALICKSALEAWVAWQAAEAAGIALSSMASTQPDHAPDAWMRKRSWSGWNRVIVTDTVSCGIVQSLATACGRPLERCSSVPTPSSTEPVSADELTDWIGEVVEGERQLVLTERSGDLLLPGDYEASRVSIHGGLHEGRMYYAFAVERRERDRSGEGFMYSYRTLVVRSDGAVLEPGLLPAPPGTPASRRVHALSDGTRIAPATASANGGSWSLAGIKRFVSRAQTGGIYGGPSGKDLMAGLVEYLRSQVWLPEPQAYDRVAHFVIATYFHRLFDAFPLLFINGPKGSGKSELMAAVVAVTFNASLMSQGSAAAVVRLARESGGLIAIDDAETLTAGFGELAQILKTGYKASTALKRLVSPSGTVETVDFFGPRVLCNTRGLGDILLSRCLVVDTSPLREGAVIGGTPDIDSGDLRDQLHEFAMSHVNLMAGIVSERRTQVSSRGAELALPLDAVRSLINS